MKQSYVFTGILAFTFLGIFLSFAQQVKTNEVAISEAMKHELALYVDRKLNPTTAVLGSFTEIPQSFLIKVTQQNTVIDLLREKHIVIVEHTDDGDVVKAIGSVGMSDLDREASKKWHFTVNGKRYNSGADRMIVEAGDVVAWYYQ